MSNKNKPPIFHSLTEWNKCRNSQHLYNNVMSRMIKIPFCNSKMEHTHGRADDNGQKKSKGRHVGVSFPTTLKIET